MFRGSQRLLPGLSMAIVFAFCETASAQAIDDSFRADIERLLEVTGAKDIGLQMAGLVSQQMLDAMQKSRPDIPPRVVQIVREVVDAHFAQSMAGPDSMLGSGCEPKFRDASILGGVRYAWHPTRTVAPFWQVLVGGLRSEAGDYYEDYR